MFRRALVRLLVTSLIISSTAFSSEQAQPASTKKCLDKALVVPAPADDSAAPVITGFFSTPAEEGLQPVIGDFDAAQKSIHYIIYNITDLKVAQALVDAKNRKLDVQVIHDLGNWTKNLAAKEPATMILQAAGIVTPSSAGFGISHPKAVAIDSGTETQKAWITSRNATPTYPVQRDAGVRTSDPLIIEDIEAIFATDLENAKTGGTLTPVLKSNWLVVSPQNAETKLVDLINSAAPNTDLYATSENLGNIAIQNALIAAQKRNVRVHVMAPLEDLNPNPQFNIPHLQALKNASVNALGMPAPASAQTPYIHQKMILVDTGKGKVAYLGSVNLSQSSASMYSELKPLEKPNREIGLIFTDEKSIGSLTTNFLSDMKVAVTDFTVTPVPAPAPQPLPQKP